MQSSHNVLSDPELKDGTVLAGLFDLPAVTTGQFAAVFRIDSSRPWAVRCLTLGDAALSARYSALQQRRSEVASESIAEFEWQDQGINVRGDWWPIVKMEWVDGLTLSSWVESNLRRPAELRACVDRVDSLVRTLWTDGIVHGDLQHGNVMVRPTGDLVLVDLDGSVVVDRSDPSAVLVPFANETGHPNYQHPHRVETGNTDAWTDVFAGTVITTSLLALVDDPELWDEFHNGENLIFTSEDFTIPFQTPVWARVMKSNSAKTRATLLEQLCRQDSKVGRTLDDLLKNGLAASVNWVPIRPTESVSAQHEWVSGKEQKNSGVPATPVKAVWNSSGTTSNAPVVTPTSSKPQTVGRSSRAKVDNAIIIAAVLVAIVITLIAAGSGAFR